MIEDLSPSLYDAAVTLWHQVGLTRPWNDPVADLRRAVDGPASAVLGAVEDGRLLGTVMVLTSAQTYRCTPRPGRRKRGRTKGTALRLLRRTCARRT